MLTEKRKRLIDTTARFVSLATTTCGLKVVVEKARKVYRQAGQATARFLEALPCCHEAQRPEVNYYAAPHD